ncbi:MAG: Crp/Fnr family transcriptional regulator [Pseudomonadota bacterium]
MRDVAPKLRSILANTSMFRMLSERELDLVVAKTSPMRMGPNTAIVSTGDEAEGTYWLVYGQVNVAVYSKQGGEKLLAILGPGKCFGLGEMMLEQPHQTCIKTAASSMVLHIERDVMMAVARDNFAFSQELMCCLGRQFTSLVRDIGTYSLSAHQRLASYLLRQGDGKTDKEIELVASKAVIASRLSVTPETLSRVLRDFSSDGMISVAGRRIKVLDWDKVNALVV